MGREIRRVPANWQHPERQNGHDGYEPLKDDYIGALEYYVNGVKELIGHLKEIKKTGKTHIYGTIYKKPASVVKYFTEDYIYFPDLKDYMPEGSWYQLFENVSEGTPLSPPFATKKELVKWMSTYKDFWGHTWTPQQAAAMVKSEYAPSGVIANGRIYTSEESVLL